MGNKQNSCSNTMVQPYINSIQGNC